MEHTSSIRTELEHYITKNNLTLSRFAEIAGMNCGTISTILKGQRSIAMSQLDKIIAGMELPPGSLYEAYAYECFVHSTPNWRRLRPFIYRCAELDMYSIIELAVRNVLDNLTYAPLLFDVAEDLFQHDKKEAAAILYTSVAESEKYQHSERLAVCQYRLFKIALTDNKDTNLQAAVRFEPYVDRLDDADQLDALKDLANLYCSLRRWEKMNDFACKMGQKAKILYELKHGNKKKNKFFKEPTKPLFGYVLYSYLMQGGVYAELENFNEALQYVELYNNTSWVIEDNHEANKLKEQFIHWAHGNKYLYQLLNGDTEAVPHLISYMSMNEHEIFPGLFKIIQAANTYKLNIDHLLLLYDPQIEQSINDISSIETYTYQIINDRFSHFLADLAYYYFRKTNYQRAFQYTLNSLSLAIKLNSEACITRGVGLFEEHKSNASDEILESYSRLKEQIIY